MNFSFNNSISFSGDGSMVIQTGSQTIKMGRGGMVIEGQAGQNTIVMNNNGIQCYQPQQYVNYSAPGFHMQTSFSTNNYGNGYQYASYEESSSDEVESSDSSFEEDNGYWEEDENGQHYNYTGYDHNTGWQVSHQVHIQPNQTMYYYSNVPAQNAEMIEEPAPRQGLTKEEIDTLPLSVYKPARPKLIKVTDGSKKKFGKGNESSGDNSCTICIMDYKAGEKLRTLPCMHRFHRGCIDKWLLMKSDCPLCKFELLE